LATHPQKQPFLCTEFCFFSIGAQKAPFLWMEQCFFRKSADVTRNRGFSLIG